MKLLIIDDTSSTREMIFKKISNIKGSYVVNESDSAKDSIFIALKKKPELIMISERLEKQNALQILYFFIQYEINVKIVFYCSKDSLFKIYLDKFSICHFDNETTDSELYRLVGCAQEINKEIIRKLTKPICLDEVSIPRLFFSSKTHRGLEFVSTNDIFYFLAEHKYVVINFSYGEILVDEPLMSIEKEFAESFIRIHRNALVSRKLICDFKRTTLGHYQVYLKGLETGLAVSRRHISVIRKLVKDIKNS